MHLREVLRVMRRSWVIIVAAVVLGPAAGLLVTLLVPENYETETKVLVDPVISADAAGNLGQAAAFVGNRMATYAALVETPAVLDPAIERSGVDVASTALVDDVTSELIPQTSIINITVEAGTALDAAELANAIAASLITEIETASTADGPVGVSGTVVEAPEIPEDPASPNLVLNVIAGLAIGLLVAFLVIVFRQALAAGTQGR